jgi:pyruvate/2-oxoglutarate dehydrogenase complex dihydrolipoamide dehydrogenase (E3) component
MAQPERYEDLVFGSGRAASTPSGTWRDRVSGLPLWSGQWISGFCLSVNCLPSKREIWSAEVAHLTNQAAHFDITTGATANAPPRSVQ